MAYAWIVTVIASFFIGWSVNAWRQDSKALEAAKAAKVEQAKREEVVDTSSRSFEKAKKEVEIRYVTKTKEVLKYIDRPVYMQQCIDDDGLRALNSEIRAAKDTGKP